MKKIEDTADLKIGKIKLNKTAIKYIKNILVFIALVLSYFVANDFINYVMKIDVGILKRIVNLILVFLIAKVYFKK